MFLGAYEFSGDRADLLPAYDRLVASLPPGVITFQTCVAHDDGITVYDACPSRAVFAAFSTSPEFRGALNAAGLPDPVVTPLGDVHATHVAPEITGRQE